MYRDENKNLQKTCTFFVDDNTESITLPFVTKAVNNENTSDDACGSACVLISGIRHTDLTIYVPYDRNGSYTDGLILTCLFFIRKGAFVKPSEATWVDSVTGMSVINTGVAKFTMKVSEFQGGNNNGATFLLAPNWYDTGD